MLERFRDSPAAPQQGVMHGPYLPIPTEDSAAGALAFGRPVSEIAAQSLHQLEQHEDAVSEARDNGHISLDSAAVLLANLIMDKIHTISPDSLV